MKRTTIDIDKEFLEEALKISKIRTIKELINYPKNSYALYLHSSVELSDLISGRERR